MKKLMGLLLLTAVLLIPLLFSCQRVDTVPTKGELTTAQIADLKSIPSGYGDLVAVTSPSNHPDWAHLWFVDQEKTIRMVRVGFTDDRLHEKVTVIPRN